LFFGFDLHPSAPLTPKKFETQNILEKVAKIDYIPKIANIFQNFSKLTHIQPRCFLAILDDVFCHILQKISERVGNL
jgi:hypothetical protein